MAIRLEVDGLAMAHGQHAARKKSWSVVSVELLPTLHTVDGSRPPLRAAHDWRQPPSSSARCGLRAATAD